MAPRTLDLSTSTFDDIVPSPSPCYQLLPSFHVVNMDMNTSCSGAVLATSHRISQHWYCQYDNRAYSGMKHRSLCFIISFWSVTSSFLHFSLSIFRHLVVPNSEEEQIYAISNGTRSQKEACKGLCQPSTEVRPLLRIIMSSVFNR